MQCSPVEKVNRRCKVPWDMKMIQHSRQREISYWADRIVLEKDVQKQKKADSGL